MSPRKKQAGVETFPLRRSPSTKQAAEIPDSAPFDNFSSPCCTLLHGRQAGCFDDLVDHDWVLADGHIGLSDRPGLGIDIREDAVAKMPYDEVMAFRQQGV